MVRPPSFDTNGIKSGVWSKDEDDKLRDFIQKHGHHNWQKLPFLAGLAKSGKSCRLRWVNYLQPGLKKGNFSKEEVDLIIRMHSQIGNKWSAIAEMLPGRSDNDIKNHWHAHIKKRSRRSRFSETGHIEEEQESFHENQDSCPENSNVEAAFDDTFFSMEEEFNDTPTSLSDSSFTYDDDQTCFSQLNIDNIPFEFSSLGLCYNDTPTFSDSSSDQGGINSCFNQLNIDLPPLISEEEFSNFELCYNDTSNFSDSSDDGITYDDHTFFGELNIDIPLFCDLGVCNTPNSSYDHACFTQMNIDVAQILEEDFSAYGLCHNHTSTFDSSDGTPSDCSTLKNEREVFGFNRLERIWYFGDDDI